MIYCVCAHFLNLLVFPWGVILSVGDVASKRTAKCLAESQQMQQHRLALRNGTVYAWYTRKLEYRSTASARLSTVPSPGLDDLSASRAHATALSCELFRRAHRVGRERPICHVDLSMGTWAHFPILTKNKKGR